MAACIYLVIYRCHQECDPYTFHDIEQHFYRVRWYLRLFAAAAATMSIVTAAVVGTFGLLFQGDGEAQEAAPPAKLLGVLPDSIAGALGLKESMLGMKGGTGAAVVALINGVVMPLILVFGFWALWLPQLPLLQRLRHLPSSLAHIEL